MILLLIVFFSSSCSSAIEMTPATMNNATSDPLTLTPTELVQSQAKRSPIPLQTSTPQIYISRWYDIYPPLAGETLRSPIHFIVTTNMRPNVPTIYICLILKNGQILAEKEIYFDGEINSPDTIEGELSFPSYSGEVYLSVREMIDHDDVFSMLVTLQTP